MISKSIARKAWPLHVENVQKAREARAAFQEQIAEILAAILKENLEETIAETILSLLIGDRLEGIL